MNGPMWNRIRRMHEEMDRIFDEFFNIGGLVALPGSKANLAPAKEQTFSTHLARAAADLYETDKEVIAKFDLPGIDKKDIDIKLTEDRLSVRVEKKAEKEEKGKDFYFMERSYAGFYRSLPLPPYIKATDAKAEYKDGVLTIRIPKDQEKLKSKEIKIDVQ